MSQSDSRVTESSLNESEFQSGAVLTSTDQSIDFILNGCRVSAQASSQRLSDYLRRAEQQHDVKIGCNAGDCGACTVLINGQPVCACLTAVSQVNGKRVDTLIGLSASDNTMRQLQTSFLAHGAAQCGICTPGMLVSAVSLLRKDPEPTEEAVKDALGGVLCRCTGYRKIISAVRQATTYNTQAALQATGLSTTDDLPPASESETGYQVSDLIQARHTVGDSIERLDGRVKVSGKDCFGDDGVPAGSREVRVIRSPFHHASFVIGDLQAVIDQFPIALDGILTATDIPGENAFGVIPPFIDQPVFAEKTTRFKGEAIAAVVGDAEYLDQIVEHIKLLIHWQELPAVLDPVSAQNKQSVQLHEAAENNIMCRGLVQHGNAHKAIMDAPYKAQGHFSTGFVEHAYIEPEAGYAQRVGETVQVYGCTQAPYMNRHSLARVLGIDESGVRIVPSAVGGGFGSKLDLSFQPFVALAAWYFGKTVRMTYSRQESMQSTTKRHPASMKVQIGADAQGRIQGMLFNGTFNTGAYASWGPTVANRVPVHASGPYYTPHYQAKTEGVYTHCAPAGAFRGFGVPQAAIAQESLYDELAVQLKMDRLAFRLHNALDNNQRTVTGQTFACGVGIKPCLEALQAHWNIALEDAKEFNKVATAKGSPVKRGVGIASGWYGCGNTSMPNPSTIKAGIKADGSVCLHQGAVDIGQGSNTVVTQLFAQALGVSVACIDLVSADTAMTPDAGKTSASRQTFVSGNAAALTAKALLAQIARHTNCAHIVSVDIDSKTIVVNAGHPDSSVLVLSELPEKTDGYVIVAEESYDPPTLPMNENGQGDPYAQFGYAAQMVTLDVDTRIGTVSLQHMVAAHDVGRAINPVLVEGQIHGGIAQGIGLALMEEFIPGRTENLHDYLIPTIGDVPSIDSIIIEVQDPHGPMGAKGLGEHVLIPTAPAILNAIADASGARIYQVPATPDRVMSALRSTRDIG